VIVAEQVTQLVLQNHEQVHAVLLALVPTCRKLRIVPERRIDKPATAGGIGVEVEGVAGGDLAQQRRT
jgi:hypothetical protein